MPWEAAACARSRQVPRCRLGRVLSRDPTMVALGLARGRDPTYGYGVPAMSVQRPVGFRRQVRGREQIVRKLAPGRDPDLVLILLHVADHLLERDRDVRPPTELGM